MMIHHIRHTAALLLALLSCLLLAACGTTPKQAHRGGVDWLVHNQNADGSWGSFESSRRDEVLLGSQASHDGFGLACAALGTMALIEPSRTDPGAWDAMNKGLDLLLTAEPVGRATGSIFYDTWAHTYMVQALALLYQDDRLAERRSDMAPVLEREIQILLDRQAAEGGWSYYDFGHSQIRPTGAQSTSFNTAAVLVAFYDAEQAGFDVDDDAIHDALNALIDLRFPQGAYAYGLAHRLYPHGAPNKIQGSIGRNQVCNLALYLWGRDLNLDDLNKGVEDLRTWHHYILIGKGRPMPHEGWYATAGYYFMFGHYYAGRVINELPEPQRTDHARWLATTITDLAEDDGSWFDFPLYGYYKAYGTAFGVMTLEEASRSTLQ
ncbi:MAG: prenyltransferase/squalene oxidase repeat-containing protein [Phycisphaerales bacterium JB063]